MPTIHLEQVTKIYRSSGRRSPTVLNLSLKIEQGEFVFLVGGPGAGKTTLLKLIGGELTPDRGLVLIDNVNLRRMGRKERDRLRRSIGVVAQEPRLVKDVTVRENFSPRRFRDRFRAMLDTTPLIEKSLALVGMAGCAERYPLELSPSENRRVELARAIMHSPSVLLLDELAAGVEEGAAWDMLHLLTELNKRGTTVILSTAGGTFVNVMGKRTVTLRDGRIVTDLRRGK